MESDAPAPADGDRRDAAWRAWTRSSTRWWRIALGLGGAWTVMTLLASTVPGGLYQIAPLLITLGFAAFIAWLFWTQSGLWHWAPFRQRWLVPGLMLLAVVLTVTGLPLHLAWAVNKPAFVALAEQHHQPGRLPMRVGTYRVSDAEVLEVRATFYTNSAGTAGFYQGDPPPTDTDRHYRHLGGNWYAFDSGW